MMRTVSISPPSSSVWETTSSLPQASPTDRQRISPCSIPSISSFFRGSKKNLARLIEVDAVLANVRCSLSPVPFEDLLCHEVSPPPVSLQAYVHLWLQAQPAGDHAVHQALGQRAHHQVLEGIGGDSAADLRPARCERAVHRRADLLRRKALAAEFGHVAFHAV